MKLSSEIHISRRPKPLDIVLFTRHLATMIKSGIPLAEALKTLSNQTKSTGFKKMIEDISAQVNNGQSLSSALSKHPETFDSFYINLIEISEESGTLEENLLFITEQLTKNYNLKKKIQTAMLYPTLIFTATTIMGGFIAYFILPQLVDFFESFQIELPITTKLLLFIATLFQNYGILIGISVTTVFIVFQLIIKLDVVKPFWHAFLLKLPIIGGFFANTQLAQFCRNFGVLIKSGVPIIKALQVASHSLSNVVFTSYLENVATSLTKGTNIADTMDKESYTIFPPLMTKMIGVGEKTGKLDESLIYLGDFFEEEIDNFSKNLTTILEPVLLISIGLIVGFIALAIITPIYELSGSIR